ncbi:hypothetical protein BJB45_03375 [Halomonas huangheensis]|uniref:Uncharacterized protein n=1 Tax=Halomonas huangheensis TaxID=1178482 RepID=W1N4T8_9GAMM|nr:hypothetical protein BJB45_03375 [Halomonas huangheensis]
MVVDDDDANVRAKAVYVDHGLHLMKSILASFFHNGLKRINTTSRTPASLLP